MLRPRKKHEFHLNLTDMNRTLLDFPDKFKLWSWWSVTAESAGQRLTVIC
jgi:hypothetical protein